MNPLNNFYETIDVLKGEEIFLAYDKIGKQICVIKERRLKTAELYSRLKKIQNPFLPKIFRTVEFEGKFFVVEEFIEGQTLAEFLMHNPTFDEKSAAKIFKQICECLKILHAHGIIHRDIKPSNIMLAKDNFVKLIDFSISRFEKKIAESDTDFLGTRGYAPPEQFGFGQTDARSDIYSLGVTIKKILGENYGGYLKKILSKCTELDPTNRYQSVEQILTDIDKKFWQHKLKNFLIHSAATFGIMLGILLVPKNIAENPPQVAEKIEQTNAPKKEVHKATGHTGISDKVEWGEIKMPSAEISSPPVQSTTDILITPEEKIKSDPRLERICTVFLNGEIFSDGGSVTLHPVGSPQTRLKF